MAGWIVMPDGIGIAKDPGVEVAHVLVYCGSKCQEEYGEYGDYGDYGEIMGKLWLLWSPLVFIY
jgi:hypothetical protein